MAAHGLVAALGVAAGSFPVLGDGMLASFAVTRLAGEVSLVPAAALALLLGAGVMGAVAGAERQVVLAAPVGA